MLDLSAVKERTIGNLVLRPVDENLIREKDLVTLEISRRKPRGTLYVLASWRYNDEGYWLRFTGNRPFQEEINKDHFWELANKGQEILDKKFAEKEVL